MSSPAHDVWLITGIPGAGKTTIARSLSLRLTRAVHIEGDLLGDWISSGRVEPGQQPHEEAERQIRLIIRNQCLLARSYARAGFVPVLDFPVVSQNHRLDSYRRALRSFDFRLVVLNPGRHAALRRDQARPQKTVAHVWVHMENELLRELAGLGLWIDGDGLSIHETVDLILRSPDRALVPRLMPPVERHLATRII